MSAPSAPGGSAEAAPPLPRALGLAALAALVLTLLAAAHFATRPGPSALPDSAVAWFVDREGTATIEQVGDEFWADRFVPLDRATPLAAPAGGQLWLRVLLDNPGPEPRAIVLEVRHRRLASADLFAATQLGDLVRQSARTPVDVLFGGTPAAGFSVDLEPRSPRVVFVRLRDRAPRELAFGGIRIWEDPVAFDRSRRGEATEAGIYLGILGTVLVYHIVVFLALRFRETGPYIVHLLAFGCLQAMHLGVGAPWAAAAPAWLADGLRAALAVAAMVALIVYAGRVLGVREAGRGVRTGLAVLVGLWLAATPLLAAAWGAEFEFAPGSTAARAGALTARVLLPVTAAALLGLGAWRWRAGRAEGPLFLLAFAAFFTALGAGPWLRPEPEALPALVQAASAQQMLLVALGVGWRLYALRRAEEDLRHRYTRRLEADVAERTAALTSANAEKDRLFAIIAHDLRGPLDGVIQAADHLARTPAPDAPPPAAEEVRSLAGAMAASGRELRSTLENLLAWARVQTGRLPPEREAVDLGRLAAALVRTFAAPARQRGLTLQIEVPAGLTALGEWEAVQSIARNLLSNAVRYSPPGGTVTLRAARAGAEVALAVEDAGPGLTAEARAGLFRLRRGPPPTEQSGAGIGLVIAGELAERLGGRIEVDSTLGAGSRFTLVLPAA